MLERQYFHYSELEENEAGLWKIVRGEERSRNIVDAAELMRDAGTFEEMMQKAVDEWPKSVLHNLTAESVNRIAWLGHAGCCIALGSPEENTRCAWHTLTNDEQDAANAAAKRVLDRWEACQHMGSMPLFRELGYA